MAVPYCVEDVCQENLDAFRKVLDLLVDENTINAADSSGNTPLTTLRDVRSQASTDGQRQLYAIAEEKLISFYSW